MEKTKEHAHYRGLESLLESTSCILQWVEMYLQTVKDKYEVPSLTEVPSLNMYYIVYYLQKYI